MTDQNPPGPGDPFADEPRRAPGRRRPSSGASRARQGGSARPLPTEAGHAPASGRSTGAPPRRVPPRPRTQPPATSQKPPPSFAPGSGQRIDRGSDSPTATRVMPTQSAGRAGGGRPGHGSGGPGGPSGPQQPGGSTTPRDPRRRGKVRRRRIAVVLVLLLVLILAWPVGLLIWANGQIQHVTALSDAADTPGTTYLLAGSDSREGSDLTDSTGGGRADSIMLLTAPESGTPSLISIPRDTFAEIPGYGPNKLNAAYSFGGPELLVETVESLTGITVDHFVEIGMGGVADVVDAVGGVELCLDYDVDDADSKLTWTAGCHVADGETALAFARMRHADPLGDIGRTQRQQQVIKAISAEVATPSLAVRPGDQVALIDAGLGAVLVSDGTGIIDLGRMALTFRSAMSDGVHGNPPIGNLDYRPGGVGSTVLIDEERGPGFWQAVLDGTVTEDDLQEY